MGNNHCIVTNRSGRDVYIRTYNIVDIFYGTPKEKHRISNNQSIIVDSIAGGSVKVAVVYNFNADSRSLFCDLFTVPDQSEFIIERVSQEAGVIGYSGNAARLQSGMTIGMKTDDLFFLTPRPQHGH